MTRTPRLGRTLFVIIAVMMFLFDRVTKLLVEDRMALGERIDVLGSVVALQHHRNSGIAFGLFADTGRLVLVGTLLVGALLFIFMLRVQPDDLTTIAGGAFITGGALGNLVDRVQHGYVTDFLQLPRWPTFNVADVSITIGVVLVLLAQLRAARDESRAEPTLIDQEETQ